MTFYDIIIIGAGPAGLTAGIYAGRANLKTLILDSAQSGGTANEAPLVENYPGFEAIAGSQLMENMTKQTQKYCEIKEYTEVTAIEEAIASYRVVTDSESYDGKYVIIATGTDNKTLDAKGIKEFEGRGVSYCAVCDGSFFIDKEVLVVGGGNSAATEALYLNRIGVKCSLVHRRDQLRCDAKLQEDLEKNNIKIYWNSEIQEVKGDMFVEEVILHDNKQEVEIPVKADGVFISIGHNPKNELAKKAGVAINDAGYIYVNDVMQTSHANIFAVGDITGGIKQISVAAAQGAIAATRISEFLIQG